MKKIVFKKNIKSEQPQEGKSNVELKSFKRSSDKNTDFSFNEDNIVEALKNIMDPGPIWALGPCGPWAHVGPGPMWALGPCGPWALSWTTLRAKVGQTICDPWLSA